MGGLAKTKLIGQAKMAGQALMCFATYNLVRMGSIGGWWDAHHGESRPQCARNGQSGLKRASQAAAQAQKSGLYSQRYNANRSAAASTKTFSTAC